MNVRYVIEPEADEGNGPIVTIRDNMIALAILIVIAVSNIFVTSHYHPWQLSNTKPSAHLTNSRTTIGCCSQGSGHWLTPCRCLDTRPPPSR
jgi:hypothetical protein